MKTFILLVLGFTAFASYALANDCECGTQNIKTRIINGQEAQRDRYPWFVSLLISAGGNSYSSCGASLISDRHILTAAHCVAENPDPRAVTAVLGAHTNDERMRTGKGQLKLKVVAVKVHENYDHDGDKMDDDIAILTLGEPVVFDDKVSPICLPTSSEHPELSVIGFGRQNFGRSLGSAKVLFEVHIDEVDNTTCTNKYWGRSFKPAKEICAGLVKSTCQGDSGGPLFHVTANGRSVQVGIVSFGTPQCGVGDAPKPAVYERVTAHLNWIEKQTKGAKWCKGPETPAFTQKNIAKQGKSFKNGGQSSPSTQGNQGGRPSSPSGRPPMGGNMPSFPSMGSDFGNMPSGSRTIRIVRTMGPDGKVTEKIENGGDDDMSRELEDMLRRMGSGMGGGMGMGMGRGLFN